MLKIIISPAKKMNVRNDILSYKNIPFFINEAQILFSYMKNMSLEELKNLWKCNDKLVQENEQQLRTGNLKQNLSRRFFLMREFSINTWHRQYLKNRLLYG